MDDARKKILARRAQFVAAALAGLSAESCGKQPREKPEEPEASVVQPTPMECLAMTAPPRYEPPPEDAAPPRPCLEPARPRVCLRPLPPLDDAPKKKASPQPCLTAAPLSDDDEG